MKFKNILIIALFLITGSAFSQDEKKMAKYLTVFADETYNSDLSLSFDRKDPNKNGWEEFSSIFQNSFVSKGFNVVLSKEAEKKTRYTIVIDYKYGYSISMYRMQCSDLTGQIIDVANQNKVVGTFKYVGRFEISNVADAIAKILADKKGTSTEEETPTKTATQIKAIESKPKTKEEKLVEVKQLYEKQLITKEEYEEQKKKILNE